MEVYKFGGSCLTSPESLERVRALVSEADLPLVCVFSALRGVTDRLIALALEAQRREVDVAPLLEEHARYLEPLGPERRATAGRRLVELFEQLQRTLLGITLLGECPPRVHDRVLSFGERAAVVLAEALLAEAGLPVEGCGEEADTGLVTDTVHGDARILPESRRAVRVRYLGAPRVHVVPGFIGRNRSGAITTLGRGGSDYTATFIGAALGARTTLWKDTAGLLSADPRIVARPRRLERLHYLDALELAHYGTAAIADKALLPPMEAGSPVEIRGFWRPEDRTCIDGREADVLAVSQVPEAVVVDFPGRGRETLHTVGALLQALAERNTYPLLLTEASPRGETSIVLKEPDLAVVEALLEQHGGQRPAVRSGLGVVAVIGSHMRGRVGFAAAIFQCLATHGINIAAIAQTASERNVSVILQRERVAEAVRALHARFLG